MRYRSQDVEQVRQQLAQAGVLLQPLGLTETESKNDTIELGPYQIWQDGQRGHALYEGKTVYPAFRDEPPDFDWWEHDTFASLEAAVCQVITLERHLAEAEADLADAE